MSGKILRTIEMELTPGSIGNAIREARDFRKQLRQTMTELVRELTAEGIEIAGMQLVSLDAVYTGELADSIQGVYFPDERRGVIFSDVPYAVFVEYGTGAVGEANPHPEPTDWDYDSHGHGEKGWVYRNDNDGKLHWTAGYVSRPFLYNTLKWLEEAAPDRMSAKLTEM